MDNKKDELMIRLEAQSERMQKLAISLTFGNADEFKRAIEDYNLSYSEAKELKRHYMNIMEDKLFEIVTEMRNNVTTGKGKK